MKTFFRRTTVLVQLTAAAWLPCAPAFAEEAQDSLLDIMRQLDADTVALTSSLMTENWSAMSAAAKAIADHPKVPMVERVKILSELGSEAPAFRSFDTQVHDAAVGISEAADRRDLTGARARFDEMLDSCIACHSLFRDRVRALREQDGNADDTR